MKFITHRYKRFLSYLNTYWPQFYRPTSYPHISGDTFRKLGDFIYEEGVSFDPSKVKKNNIVFVDTKFIDEYLLRVHNQINAEYILITHNSIKCIDKKYIKKADSKIIHWFAENLMIENNEKFTAIPLGLENKKFNKNSETKSYKNKDYQRIKNSLVICSFATQTNKEVRQPLYDLALEHKFIDISIYKNHENYIEALSNYKFSLCPEGSGIDTHRFWESLMVGTVPIVTNNCIIKNFSSIGVPILKVNEWEEINDFDEEYLNAYYDNCKVLLESNEYLNFDFWKKAILKKQI
jgi:hypothetical protein